MEKKIQKVFIDDGFGFPVKLLNVPMIKVRGVWTPHINYNKLAKDLLKALCEKSAPLTGDEVKFVRNNFGMTLQVFADRFAVTHAAVIKWEKKGNQQTDMNWATEKDLRLFAYAKVTDDLKKIAGLYLDLENRPSEKTELVHLDTKKLAA